MTVERKESTASTSTSDFSQYPVHSLPIEGCLYRGEGNANLVVALPSERKVIRLRKSPGGKSLPEDEARRVRREVDFIRGVISGLLGGYVCTPEILRCASPEIARLSEKIRPARPENRLDKDIVGGYATKFPDYTFLPEHLSSFSTKPTFCVEIKPKQGFLCNADRQLKKCPYCLTQYYKVKKGSIKEPSTYCPFDLFSNQTHRMNRALQSLLRSPQNNFKIFKNGQVTYDESIADLDPILNEWFHNDDPLESFLELVRIALTRGFEASVTQESIERELGEVPTRFKPGLLERANALLRLANEECEMSGENLPSGSVLERILRMQKLHRCGADAVTWINAKFSAVLNDELIYTDLIRTGDVASNHQEVSEYEHVAQKQLHDWSVSNKVQCSTISYIKERNNSLNKAMEQTNSNNINEQNYHENMTFNEYLNYLKNYLLFCTAKDCSILMAFQEIDKEMSTHIISEHRIDLPKNQSFLVNVRVLDLDMKSLQCIKKHHRRDNDVLQATILELEKKLCSLSHC